MISFNFLASLVHINKNDLKDNRREMRKEREIYVEKSARYFSIFDKFVDVVKSRNLLEMRFKAVTVESADKSRAI